MLEEEKDLHTISEHYMKEKLTNVLSTQPSFLNQLSVSTNLFDQLKSKFFNEMLDDVTSNGEASKKLNNGYRLIHWRS